MFCVLARNYIFCVLTKNYIFYVIPRNANEELKDGTSTDEEVEKLSAKSDMKQLQKAAAAAAMGDEGRKTEDRADSISDSSSHIM